MSVRSLFVRTFTAAFIVSLFYYAIGAWRLEDPAWTGVGGLIASGASPLLATWLDSTAFSWSLAPLREAASLVLIPAAFSLNIAIVASGLLSLQRLVSPARSPQPS